MLENSKHPKNAVLKHKNPIKLSRVIFILSFILIPTLHFAIFYVYVNLNSFIMAFQLNKGGTIYWTLENFSRFFTEFLSNGSEMGQAFKNTFITFIIQQVMFLIGFLVSYFLYKKIFLYRAFRVFFFLPSLVAGTIVSSIFMKIVGVDGPFSLLFQKMFNLDYRPELLADSQFANQTVWMHMIWLSFPGNMVLFGGAFGRIPESVIESAKLDGVNWIQEAFRIIVPMVWPTIGLLLMLNIAGIFGASGSVFLLTKGGYGTQTLSNWMYMQIYNLTGNPGESNAFNYMSAVGMMLTIVSVTLAFILRKLSGKIFDEVQY